MSHFVICCLDPPMHRLLYTFGLFFFKELQGCQFLFYMVVLEESVEGVNCRNLRDVTWVHAPYHSLKGTYSRRERYWSLNFHQTATTYRINDKAFKALGADVELTSIPRYSIFSPNRPLSAKEELTRFGGPENNCVTCKVKINECVHRVRQKRPGCLVGRLGGFLIFQRFFYHFRIKP